MAKTASYVQVSCVLASLVSALVSMPALAGGNGNGGSGSGGAHGAATSERTYHSEPVSSPWNRDPGDVNRTYEPGNKASSQAMPQSSDMSSGAVK
ncbi:MULTISPECIES: hypothetical protein [unclassified Caballeronia]|uniref:hypothetical protein n=1 Tax=unclassified Caballeronia TaxID=2646786 RepID=UPI00285C4ACF|nr:MULTISPECIES: hypothetical protein [unclassified Caballeronia]MDR5773093.1 hypothetical protein [Caballeronia sp. LZ002]MDR5848527.1 hypothetical protein [Caballeronia sp. LZ003]